MTSREKYQSLPEINQVFSYKADSKTIDRSYNNLYLWIRRETKIRIYREFYQICRDN